MSNELEEYMKTSFCHKFCSNIEQAVKMKFPDIVNLEVGMDEEGCCTLIFDETIYTQKQVLEFITELKQL